MGSCLGGSLLRLVGIGNLIIFNLVAAVPRNSTLLSCTRGVDKTDFLIQCTGSTPYINIRNIFYGALHITSPCNGEASYDSCCGRGVAIPECVFHSNTDLSTISDRCVVNQCEVGPGSSIRTYGRCDPENYPQLTSFMFVEYECTAARQTTPRAPATARWDTPTPWVLPTTTEYRTKLTPGGQAGVIVFIMLVIIGIAAGITVYKRWKYGAPEDKWKFFSNPPHLSASQQDIPKVIPWVSGEAREQIYKTYNDFINHNDRKQIKRQMINANSFETFIV
ncbi:unnamed protein product [Lymnaea stagnalis]|uniref:SUEL-type lectin domain-containing protein n=1 Tax=Lymnaea stagnalis TaxID=6523 RepID=A0AAV2HXX2_LYMST